MNSDLRVVLLVDHPGILFERLAGLTVLERHLHVLRNAGVRRVLACAHRPAEADLAALRIPEGLELLWGDASGQPFAPPYVSVCADDILLPQALEELLDRLPAAATAWHDEDGRSVVQYVPASSEDAPSYARLPMPPGSFFRLSGDLSAGPALDWLLHGAGKSHDSFMARHFDRRLSMAITRRLLDTRVSPNMMTVFSTLVGIAGAAVIGVGGYGPTLVGSVVVWAHTVLDGCDGELARLRHQQSPLGGLLDFWGDNIVHAALFLGLGIGLQRSMAHGYFLALGAAAALGALFCAWDVYRHRALHEEPGHPLFDGLEEQLSAEDGMASPGRRRLAALEDALARRDFVYLLVLLALADYPEAFLWAAGIGTPLFLWALIYLRHSAGQHRICAPLRRPS